MAADETYTITIFPTTIPERVTDEPITVWHWKRLSADGAQVDGSGPQRNGFRTKKQAKDLVRERYPDDKITGG